MIHTMKPQTRKVLEHLLVAGSITNVEANAVLRCRSVHARIGELERDHGFFITRVIKTDSQGQRYTQYSLANPHIAKTYLSLMDKIDEALQRKQQ